MRKKMLARIARAAAFALTVMIAVANINVMTVNAAGDYGNTQYGYELEDMNALGATVTVKSNMLKVKKNNAPQTVKPTKVVVNGVALKLNKNYTILYQVYDENRGWLVVNNLTAPGLYRMCIVGMGNYKGVTTKNIYVYDPKDGERCTPVSSWKIVVNKVPYTGEPITEGVIKSVKYKKMTLVEGEDYTVRYLNNVNSGAGTVRITAIEGTGFVGERDVKFQITGGAKINKAKVTGIVAKTYDYGNAVEQDMSQVKVMVGKNELAYGVDYDVAYYMNNTKVGTAKIIINGKGRYNGSIAKTFKINKIALNSDMLDDVSRSIVVEYTKKANKPEVTLYNSNGEQLVKNTDYTLAYKNNVKKSEKAVITVKGKGNYAGSFNMNFKIVDKIEEEKPVEPVKPVKPEKPETPEKPEVPETGDGEESKGDETIETGETTGEESKGDETGETIGDENKGDETGETTGDENKGNETGDTTGDTTTETGETTGDENKGDKTGETTETGETTGEESKGDDTAETGETTGEESKGDESVTPVQKPIGFRICDCQTIMPIYTYGMSDIEKKTWSDHLYEHNKDGWTPTYTTVSYEKALKYKIIKENADGSWTLLQGTLLLPSESKVEEPVVEESQAETTVTKETTETEESEDTKDPVTEETKEPEVKETDVPEVDPDKLIGLRMCWCGCELEIYGCGLTKSEESFWKDHINCHARNGESTDYTETYF
ncbi:MAG: hypothetical protein HDR09_21165 [Lachnospiraceae bacterium]|nr:hypothetical protein [Lachnospiraceae bacterium]